MPWISWSSVTKHPPQEQNGAVIPWVHGLDSRGNSQTHPVDKWGPKRA